MACGRLTQLYPYSESSHRQYYKNWHGCIPIKLCLLKEFVGPWTIVCQSMGILKLGYRFEPYHVGIFKHDMIELIFKKLNFYLHVGTVGVEIDVRTVCWVLREKVEREEPDV